MSANLFSLFIIVLIANVVLAGLLPRIQDDNVLLEPTAEDKYAYKLSIVHPEGALREETVQEIETGQPLVNGEYSQDFALNYSPSESNPEVLRVIVTYEAGPNGYVAKYNYILTKRDPVILSLSPNSLKAITG